MKKTICFLLLMAMTCLFIGGGTGCKSLGNAIGGGDQKKKDNGLSSSMNDVLNQERPY